MTESQPGTSSDETALRDAAAWMVRIAAPGSGAADREALRRWLAEHPRNLAAMDLVERSWRVAGDLERTPGIQAERARARRLRLATAADAPRRQRLWLAPAAGAGALALAAALALALFPPVNYGLGATHRTAMGQSLETSLPDGSRVRLNTDTELHIDYGWLGRHVALTRGEAEFVVAHGDPRAFTVSVNGIEVRATGTVFTVRDTGEGTRVFLLEGGVRILNDEDDRTLAVLRPGERAELDRSGIVALAPADAAAERAWLAGQLLFRDTPLPDALAEFARYTHVDVQVAPPLRELSVSGVYRATDLQAFLDAVSRIHPVGWRQIGPGRVVLEPGVASKGP